MPPANTPTLDAFAADVRCDFETNQGACAATVQHLLPDGAELVTVELAGSYAHGSPREESDVDLLVRYRGDVTCADVHAALVGRVHGHGGTFGIVVERADTTGPAQPRLRVENYDGQAGNPEHVTRVERGTVPTGAVAHLDGSRGERPGQHRRRHGDDWAAFKRDIAARGIVAPIFVTVDCGQAPKIVEGNHRRDAAVELGLAEVPVEVRYFGHAQRDRTLT